MFTLLEQQYANLLEGNIEAIQQTVNKLTSVNTCPYCVLRFLGLREADVYRCVQYDELHQWIESIVKYKITDEFVCRVCLGILQRQYSSVEFIDLIYEDVQQLEFEFDDFLCSLSLPVSILVREHALWLTLLKEFPLTYKDAFPKDNISPIKDVWKWLNGPKLVEKFKKPVNQKSIFNIQLNFEYEFDDKECYFLLALNSSAFRKRKKSNMNNDLLNRLSVQRALDSCQSTWFQKLFPCPPQQPEGKVKCLKITCHRESIYLGGLYNKYSRILSQTPWFIGEEKKFEDSIEEIISRPIKKMTQPADMKFSASGREDVDVRMLGRGRPFLIELINSKKLHFSSAELASLSELVNISQDVQINQLQPIEKSHISILKEGEDSKIKMYKALCTYVGPISETLLLDLNKRTNIVLQQRTPLRVLHRRPLAVRERTVHTIEVVKVNEGRLVVNLSTQAGTYVKEFVHGDFGRTTPCLGDLLGTECDIIALDVEQVLIDWPPQRVTS